MSETKPKIGQAIQDLWIDEELFFHNNGENGANLYRQVNQIDWEKVWKEYEKEKWERLGIALKTGQNYTPVNVKLIQELVEKQLKGE